MSLSPEKGASLIAENYKLFAGIDSDGMPTGAESEGDYPLLFSSSYDDYASDGVVPGAKNLKRSQAVIESFMRSLSGGSSAIRDFAIALASYWATVAVDQGSPAHGGISVLSVSNNALSKVDLFESAILASYTTVESKPWALDFISKIERLAVKDVIWTVTELMPNGSVASFSESIS